MNKRKKNLSMPNNNRILATAHTHSVPAPAGMMVDDPFAPETRACTEADTSPVWKAIDERVSDYEKERRIQSLRKDLIYTAMDILRSSDRTQPLSGEIVVNTAQRLFDFIESGR